MHYPAVYVWTGSAWVLSLPIWQAQTKMQMREMWYSDNGSSWTR